MAELGIGFFGCFFCKLCLFFAFFFVSGSLCVCSGFSCHVCAHNQPSHSWNVVFRVENLQRQLAAMGVQSVCQLPEGWNLTVVIEHRGRRGGAHRRNVADYNVRSSAFGQAFIEAKAPGANGAVPFLIAGSQRRKHNSVFQCHAANLDWF